MKAWTHPKLGNCEASSLLGSPVHSLSLKSFQAAPGMPSSLFLGLQLKEGSHHLPDVPDVE